MDARERGAIMYRLADLIEPNLKSWQLWKRWTPKTYKRLIAATYTHVDCPRYYAGYADKIHGQTIPVQELLHPYKKEPVVSLDKSFLELPHAHGCRNGGLP